MSAISFGLSHSPTTPLPPVRYPPLFKAVIEGNLDKVADEIRGGCKPNEPDARGRTPLFWAADTGYLEAVLLIANAYKESNLVPNDEERAAFARRLHYVAIVDDSESLSLLLSAFKELGLELNLPDSGGRTALIHAALHGYVDFVCTLVKGYKELNQELNDVDQDALIRLVMKLANNGELDEVRKLDDLFTLHQIPLNCPCRFGRTIFQSAAESNRFDMVLFLLKRYGEDEIELNPKEDLALSALFSGRPVETKSLGELAKEGELTQIEALIELCKIFRTPLDSDEIGGDQAMLFAIQSNNVSVVNALVQGGVTVKANHLEAAVTSDSEEAKEVGVFLWENFWGLEDLSIHVQSTLTAWAAEQNR